jgi:hypothetical protein
LIAGKGLSLVVMNACQSGMTQARAGYLSVGNQLLRAGIRGVVAMSYSVFVDTAVRFIARFYESLINGEEVSRAVALGREELRVRPDRFSPRGNVSLRDWVVPILFEAAPFQAVRSGSETSTARPARFTSWAGSPKSEETSTRQCSSTKELSRFTNG